MVGRPALAGGIVIGLVAVALLALHVLVTVIVDEDFLSEAIRDTLGERPVRVADLSYSYFPLSISLTDVEIGNPAEMPAGEETVEPLLSLGRLDMRIRAWSVFSRPLVVDGLTVERLDIHLWRGAKGKANWRPAAADDVAPPEKETPPPEEPLRLRQWMLQIVRAPPVIFRRVDLSDVSIGLADYREGRHMRMEKTRFSWSPEDGQGLNAGASFEIADRVSGEWELGSGVALSGPGEISLPDLTFAADIRSRHLPDGKGSVSFEATPVWSEKDGIHMDSWKLRLPYLVADGQVRLSADSLDARLRLEVTSVLSILRLLGFPEISSQHMVAGGNTLAIDAPKIMWDWSAGVLEVRTLTVDGLGMAVEAALAGENLTGENLTGDGGSGKLDGRVRGQVWDLSSLLKFYAFTRDEKDGLPVRLAAAYPGPDASRVNLAADFAIDREEDSLSLQGLQARFFDVDVVADMRGRDGTLTGEYRISGGNVGRLMSVILDESDEGAWLRLGAADIQGSVAGSIDRPVLRPLDVSFDVVDRIDIPHRYQVGTWLEADIPERRLRVRDLVISGSGLAARSEGIALGRSDGGVSVSGHLRIDQASPRRFIDMVTALPADAAPDALQRLDGNVEFDLNAGVGRIGLVAHLDGTAMRATMELARRENLPALTWMLDTGRLDLDRYLLLPDEPAAPVTASPAAQAEMEPPLIGDARVRQWRRMFLDGKWLAEELVVRGARFPGFQAHLTMPADGTLAVRIGSERFYDGSVQADMTVDGGSSPIRLGAKAQMDGVQLSSLLSDVIGVDDWRGQLNASAALHADDGSLAQVKRGLGGEIRLDVSEGSYSGADLLARLRTISDISQWIRRDVSAGSGHTDFSSLRASAVLENGVAVSDDLEAVAPGLRITGGGRYSIPGNSVDYEALLHVDHEGAEASVPVTVEGSPPALRYSVDVAETAAQTLLPGLLGGGGSWRDVKDSLRDSIRETILGDRSDAADADEEKKNDESGEKIIQEGLKKLLPF